MFCELIVDYLRPHGYEVTVASNGPSGLKAALEKRYAAVLLDVMLPGMDGFELLRHLRERSDVPVLMLTSRGDEADRIEGLDTGADDYLPKTFSTRELLARLRAVTRRISSVSSAESESSADITVGRLTVAESSRRALFHNEPLALTSIEFDLLLMLAKSAGTILSREVLAAAAAGKIHNVFDRSIDVHISSLRRKLGDKPTAQHYIVTVRSKGYMMPEHPESEAAELEREDP